MAATRGPIRGAQDIKTHTGRVTAADTPSKAYLRLACLEMEKERRDRERQSAAQRMKTIDARFQEIEDEKVALLQKLGARHGPSSSPGPRSPSAHNGVRITY